MPSRSGALAFAARFVLILGVYLLPWNAVGVAYSSLAAALGNAVFADALGGAGIQLEFARAHGTGDDSLQGAFAVVLRATDLARGPGVSLLLDLRSLAYVPTAVFVALAVAAPIWKGRRGARVLAGGLALLHAFIAATLAITVVLFLSGPAPLRDHAPGVVLDPAVGLVLQLLHRVFVAPPGMAVAVPVLVWLLALQLVPDDPARSHFGAPANRQAETAVLR